MPRATSALAHVEEASSGQFAASGDAAFSGARLLPNPHNVPSDVTIWRLEHSGDNSAGPACTSLTSEDWKELSLLRGEARSRSFRVRAFLRVALSAAVDGSIDPGAWRFERSIYGKPLLAAGHEGPQFTISHSGNTSFVAISTMRRVGLDIAQRAVHDWHEVAVQLFTSAERSMINAARPAEREATFLRIWTAKEAFAKLIGAGLALHAPANDCGFGTRLASWIVGSPSGDLQISLAFDDLIDRQELALGMKQTK